MNNLELFMLRVPSMNPAKCWPFPSSADPYGYRRCKYEGRTIPAHRGVYLASGRSIPPGYHLDHLCRTPACVNPDHLEPVTHAENLRRGVEARRSLGEIASDGIRPDYAMRVAAATAGVRAIPHGVNGYSNYGCRCDVCREATITYKRERRHAKRMSAMADISVSA